MPPKTPKCKPKFLPWKQVQDRIISLLKSCDTADVALTVPYGPQLAYSLHHHHTMKCMTFYHSTAGDIYVTHYDAGVSNQVQLWTVNSFNDIQIQYRKFNVQPTITTMIFVPQHRVFAGFCSDLCLRIFSDAKHRMAELTSTQCPTTMLCMVYNDVTDELIAGGYGSIQSWKMNHVELRGALQPGRPFECNLSRYQWVTNLKLDKKNHQLLVLCDDGVYIINYKTNKQTHFIRNWHSTSLSSCVFYRPLEYFITAAKDGSIKVWNAVVFSIVHEFIGHYDRITGLIVHPSDPLLLSSSKDGTIRIWRLDTFEQTFRLDIGEKIYGMKIASTEQLYFHTLRDIKILNFNQFHHIFTPIQSCIHKLTRVTSLGKPSRILCVAEDGSVRLLSSISGSVLTIIYPMATYQVLTDIVYDPRKCQIYTALATGEVLVFDASTNPCSAYQLWVPHLPDDAILCLTLIKLDPALGYSESIDGETLIFAGHCNGQISLIEADSVTMKLPVQAHCGQVTTLEHSHGNQGQGHATANADRLMSAGTDKKVKIWQISVQDDYLTLSLMHKIDCDLCPTHISMLGDVACLAMPNNCIDMYRMPDKNHCNNKGEDSSNHSDIHRLKHHKDDNHTQQITAMCRCQRLGLFATTSADGSVKIWNTQNQLVRELCLDHTVRGVCFANDRGDLLVGFQNHVSYIPIMNYLPPSMLEEMSSQDFTDEAVEEPMDFNPDLQLWFDIRNLLALPADLNIRHVMTKVMEKLQSESSAGEGERSMSVSDQEILKSLSEIAEAEQEISLSPEELEQLTELAAYSLDKLSKSKSQPAVSVPSEPIMAAASKAAMLKSSSLCAVVSDAKQVPSQQQIEEDHDKLEDEEKAAEVTEDKEEKKNPWPIAPDGYIPNSVIRALMGYKPPPIQPLPIPWKLKPVPTLPSPISKASSSPSFLDEPIIWESSSEEEIYEFSDFDFEEFDEDEEDSLMPLEVRRKSVAMAKQQKLRKQSLKYPPIKPMKLPKLKKFGKREIPKTMMEEGEEEEEEKEKMEKKEVTVTSLLIKISKMTWFPSDEEVDKENVVDVLIDLLVKVTPFTHRAVCQALIDIHKEFVIDDRQLDMAVNRLNKQLKHEHAMIRVNAVKTLGGFGFDRKDVILGLLPVLIDKAENVRQEATNTLTKLTGIRDRQGLATLFEKYGILQRYTNRDREVIRELAERQQRKYMEESEKMMAPYRSRPSGFYGKDLGEDEKAPSMLELWVASTKAGLKPDNEDLSKEYSTESLADVIDADFSPWEHTKQRATMDAKHPKTVQFKSSRSLNKFKSYEEMPSYDDMRYFAAQRDRRQSRIQHRTVFREVTDGYMERLIRQKEELAAAMKEQLLRHRSRYRAAVKRGKAAKRFLPNQPDFYKFYAHKRPSHHLKSFVRPQGAGDRVGISDQYRPVHVKEGKLTAQPGRDNDLKIVLDDKWKHQDTEGSSLFPDTDSGIHSEQVTASSIKQEQLQSISSQIEPSKSQQGDKALKDEKLLQQLHGMYTSTEISLGDSGVGCPSDISSLRIENIDSLPSEMSSFRKKENWRELFQRPTAQQRKQFYEKQRKARELKEMTLPPIVYLHDDVEMTDGVAGQRLLKKLSMIDRKKQHIDEEMHWHVIESMPAKLDVHTNRETTGSTKFGVLNMTWTTAVPSYDRITQLSKQHTMKRALERRKKEAQHSNVTSPEEILDKLHHHWQSRRRSNNLSSLSKLESHYEWSSAPAVIIPHIGEEESLSSLASQDSDSDQKAEKISTLPSVHVPRVKSINNTDTRGRQNTQGEEKLPEINEALKFLTTKEAVPQSN